MVSESYRVEHRSICTAISLQQFKNGDPQRMDLEVKKSISCAQVHLRAGLIPNCERFAQAEVDVPIDISSYLAGVRYDQRRRFEGVAIDHASPSLALRLRVMDRHYNVLQDRLLPLNRAPEIGPRLSRIAPGRASWSGRYSARPGSAAIRIGF